MTTLYLNKCRLCGGPTSTIIETFDRRYNETPNDKFRVYVCTSCGVAQTFPVPDNLSAYYPKKYYRDRVPPPDDTTALQLTKRLVIQLVKDVDSFLGTADLLPSEPRRLLVVGCGPGHKLNAYRRQGWDVVGVEPNHDAVELGRSLYDVPIVHGSLTQSFDELSEWDFDTVLLDNVFEHIANPTHTLKLIKLLLQNQGYVIIEVPNFKGWERKWLGEWWGDYDVPRHLYHYSPESLDRLMKQSGFSVDAKSYDASPRLVSGWLARCLMDKILDAPSVSHRPLQLLLLPLLLPYSVVASLASRSRFRHRYRLGGRAPSTESFSLLS